MTRLTDKQALFAQEYLLDLNATQAAIRAGYSPKTAYSSGQRLLTLPHVLEYIQKLKQERLKQLGLDAHYVLLRLVDIDQMDVLDILNDDMTFKSLREWPAVWRRYISGVDITAIFSGSGDERAAGVLKKIKWPDKVKNLELIGKHISVGAFKERIEHSGHIETLSEEALEEKIREFMDGQTPTPHTGTES